MVIFHSYVKLPGGKGKSSPETGSIFPWHTRPGKHRKSDWTWPLKLVDLPSYIAWWFSMFFCMFTRPGMGLSGSNFSRCPTFLEWSSLGDPWWSCWKWAAKFASGKFAEYRLAMLKVDSLLKHDGNPDQLGPTRSIEFSGTGPTLGHNFFVELFLQLTEGPKVVHLNKRSSWPDLGLELEKLWLDSEFQNPHTLHGFVKNRGCPCHIAITNWEMMMNHQFLLFSPKKVRHAHILQHRFPSQNHLPIVPRHFPSTRCGAILGTSPVIIANEMLG